MVIQRSEEFLLDSLIRFHTEVSSVPRLEPYMAIYLLTQGLLLGEFRNSLIGEPPHNLSEIRRCLAKYVNLEEFEKGVRARRGQIESMQLQPLPPLPKAIELELVQLTLTTSS